MAGTLRLPLHAGQIAIHNSDARFKVVVAGRRFGKSYLAAVELLIEALRDETPEGRKLTEENEVYYIAPIKAQGKKIMVPKIKEIGKFVHEGGVIKDYHINDGVFTLINGRKISLLGADDPDALRGVGLSYVVLDEYADMKEEVWEEILRPALMDVRGRALFIGTPKGKNHFYRLYQDALLGDDPDWEAFTFTSLDNPTLPPEEVAKQADLNNERANKRIIEQELYAKFVTRGSETFPSERWVYDEKEPADGYYVIACDLAGFKKEGGEVKKRDNSAIAVVKICKRGWWIKEIIYGQWGVRETAEKIIGAAYSTHASRVGIERGIAMEAVLPYMQDVMKRMGVFYTVEPLSHMNQRKADRIEWALAGRHEKGRLILNADPNQWPQKAWVEKLLEEASDFPDPLAHDDLIDALAYVDQLGETVLFDWHPGDGTDDWEPLDDIAGV